jgi:hypothetical protein
MSTQPSMKAGLSRRSVLFGGMALLSGGAILATAHPLQVAHSAPATYNLIWNEWGPLTGYGVSAECNPGGTTSFSCGLSDVSITTGSDSSSQYSNVTANPNGNTTFVNAIGNIKFTNSTPDGQPLALKSYQYVYAVRLPLVPTRNSAPLIAEQVHQMIMFWDGANQLWQANKHTLEATIYWKLNPWDPNYGKIFVYTMNGSNLVAYDTGIILTPDTNWHVFDVRADFLNQVFVGISIDGQWNPLTNVSLAQISHPDWGSDLSLALTAESQNAYPGSTNPIVTQWTTQFKDPKLYRFD